MFIDLFYLLKYKEETFIRGFKPFLFNFIQIHEGFKELKCFAKNFDQHFKVLSVDHQNTHKTKLLLLFINTDERFQPKQKIQGGGGVLVKIFLPL